jgi:HPt (histidine-containing phosphotransfer) domain-containing protein
MSGQPIPIEAPPGLEAIVPGYLAMRREELPQMIEMLAVSDFGSLASLAHALKGSGTSYGFPDLTRIGAALEGSAKQRKLKALRTQLAELKDYLDRVELKGNLPDRRSLTQSAPVMEGHSLAALALNPASIATNQLPAKLWAELGAAVRTGRKRAIDELVAQVRDAGNDQVADTLSALADNYEYEALLQLLEEKC